MYYSLEKSKLNLIIKFQPNRMYGFWEIAVDRFFEFYCFYQYRSIDRVDNEEN